MMSGLIWIVIIGPAAVVLLLFGIGAFACYLLNVEANSQNKNSQQRAPKEKEAKQPPRLDFRKKLRELKEAKQNPTQISKLDFRKKLRQTKRP
jgi:flagellar basal body-associated protein FliL